MSSSQKVVFKICPRLFVGILLHESFNGPFLLSAVILAVRLSRCERLRDANGVELQKGQQTIDRFGKVCRIGFVVKDQFRKVEVSSHGESHIVPLYIAEPLSTARDLRQGIVEIGVHLTMFSESLFIIVQSRTPLAKPKLVGGILFEPILGLKISIQMKSSDNIVEWITNLSQGRNRACK